jgi:hypothetical protein
MTTSGGEEMVSAVQVDPTREAVAAFVGACAGIAILACEAERGVERERLRDGNKRDSVDGMALDVKIDPIMRASRSATRTKTVGRSMRSFVQLIQPLLTKPLLRDGHVFAEPRSGV